MAVTARPASADEAHVPLGGPDGGDGGHGGSVSLIVDIGETTLGDYRFKHHFRAADGGRGEGSRRHGKNGSDLDLKVPPGTVVFDADGGDLLADLVVPGQRFTVAQRRARRARQRPLQELARTRRPSTPLAAWPARSGVSGSTFG